jgi:hypothetical protein
VDVLEHEQCGPAPADAGQQTGDGRVQPVALGVRIGLHSGGERAHARIQVGEEPGELATAASQRGPELVGLGGPDQVVERLDEGPVGRAHLGVTVAIQDQRAVLGGMGRELPHQATLARAGLAPQ